VQETQEIKEPTVKEQHTEAVQGNEIEKVQDKFHISKEERKIGLTNVFGKASTGVGIASLGYLCYELGSVIVFATNTATQNVFNPADHVAPGLIAFGLSLAGGLSGMYLGRTKHRLANEFNYQVKKEFANMGFELVDDEPEMSSSKPKQRWVRRESDYTPTVYRPRHDRFWEGFWISSMLNSNSRSSRGYSSSRSRSSSSSSNNGQGAAVAIALIALAAAVAASAFVSWKSFQLNFVKKSPPLLTGPEPEVFSTNNAPQI
jgi:hypothetical protein